MSCTTFGAYLYWEDPDRLHGPLNNVKRGYNKAITVLPESVRDSLTLHVERDPIPAGKSPHFLFLQKAHIFKPTPPPTPVPEQSIPTPIIVESTPEEPKSDPTPEPALEPEPLASTPDSLPPPHHHQDDIVLGEAIIIETPPELQQHHEPTPVVQEPITLQVEPQVEEPTTTEPPKETITLENSEKVQEMKSREDYKKYKELLELQVKRENF